MTNPSELAAVTQAGRDLFARWENGDATEAEVAGGLWAFIDALSTPPADGVREAATRSLTGGERLTPDESMQHAYAIAVTRAPGRMTWGEALRHFATWMREHDTRLISEVRPHGTVTPTVDEWAEQMDAERARQIEHGYDDARDAQHGTAHLLNWAIDYARRGNNLAAATMARCALRLPRGTVTDAEEAWKTWKGDCMTRPPKASFMAGWNAAREDRS